jgi:hypothetical protein
MATESYTGAIGRFARYDERTDFERWHAMALASFVPLDEGYVLGIDCADRWLFTRWGTKLVLTDERIGAFTADPNNPMKQTYWLEKMSDMSYDEGLLTDELRLVGTDSYGAYTVPKRLGREFAEAVENALVVEGTEST